jgi:histidine triad (HIT) family protein
MACLFCQIVEKEIQAKVLYEDDSVLAFQDINPQAPVHFLVIPKEHIPTLNMLEKTHAALIGKMVTVATNLAADQGVRDSGYRIVMNCNQDGGQAVFHIHLHCLGGRRLNWPPG